MSIFHGINIEIKDSIYRKESRDPVFYCDGYGHAHVLTVLDKETGNEVRIYCDGEMRINLGDYILRNSDDLTKHGILTEQDLEKVGQDAWVNNPWFDMYLYTALEDGSHMNFVHFDALEEGVPMAILLLLEVREQEKAGE